MKQLLFISLLLSSFSGFSQVWIDQDAVWHYDINAGSLFQGFSKYEYTSDSIIQGHNCQVIEKNQHRVVNYNGIYSHTNHQMETNFTYTNGDTVFWLVEDEFKVLYNFGAQPGDTWVTAEADTSVDCLEAIIEVDSVGTIQLNGENLRWIAFHSLDNSSYIYGGRAVEKFGFFEMNYFGAHALFPVKADCTEGTTVDYFFNSFTCYEDASFNLYNITTQDCEYKASLSLNELNSGESGIVVYMNQEEKVLYLENSEITTGITYTVINSLGQQVMKEQSLFQDSNSETIDVAHLNSGIYLIRINNNGFYQNKRILIAN